MNPNSVSGSLFVVLLLSALPASTLAGSPDTARTIPLTIRLAAEVGTGQARLHNNIRDFNDHTNYFSPRDLSVGLEFRYKKRYGAAAGLSQTRYKYRFRDQRNPFFGTGRSGLNIIDKHNWFTGELSYSSVGNRNRSTATVHLLYRRRMQRDAYVTGAQPVAGSTELINFEAGYQPGVSTAGLGASYEYHPGKFLRFRLRWNWYPKPPIVSQYYLERSSDGLTRELGTFSSRAPGMEVKAGVIGSFGLPAVRWEKKERKPKLKRERPPKPERQPKPKRVKEKSEKPVKEKEDKPEKVKTFEEKKPRPPRNWYPKRRRAYGRRRR